ncbi:MAG: pyrroline-5-carboxylate reductase [Lachnospiraceae bacterium]|nr:pyrroline-5-carboxylate reductase [Lachnospiraceae bacterium]
MKKLGFIGMGNMAQAIAGGFISRGIIDGNDVYAYAPNTGKLKQNAQRIGFEPADSISNLVESSDTVIMACKPYQIDSVLDEISALLKGKALLSIALGWDYAKYKDAFEKRNVPLTGKDRVRIQFIMPNTPAQVGEGVFLFEQMHTLDNEERMQVMDAFSKLGMVREISTDLMGIGGAITGCGPAFIDMYIEAMGDAAVKYGIPRKLAYELVSATVKGTAALQIETGTHPGELKDAVCSPGGSTIRGVTALEEAGFRDACIKAIDAIQGK